MRQMEIILDGMKYMQHWVFMGRGSACRGQRRVSDPLELELQAVVSHPDVGARN